MLKFPNGLLIVVILMDLYGNFYILHYFVIQNKICPNTPFLPLYNGPYIGILGLILELGK